MTTKPARCNEGERRGEVGWVGGRISKAAAAALRAFPIAALAALLAGRPMRTPFQGM